MTGLADDQVRQKQEQEGYNELPQKKSTSFWHLAFSILKEPMFLLLVACGTLYLCLGDVQEGVMLMGFVIFIMCIEFYQERKTGKALEALKELSSPKAVVIRHGEMIKIPTRELVVDDLIVLNEGERVPADAVLIQAVNIQVDESLLTGESVPVRKIESDGSETEMIPGGDDLPFVFSGTMLVQGNGIARVLRIGQQTEIGKIGQALDSVAEEPTKLNTDMNNIVRKLAIGGLFLCLIVVAVYFLTRGDLLHGFLAGLTLAMGILPEEFPVILTIFMALGAWRISKQRVLTRQPSVIETLGSATVLCTDKTGTLTQNRMVVNTLYNKKTFLDASNMHATGVSLENVSDQTAQLAVQGPKAGLALQKLTKVDLSAIPYYHFTYGTFACVEQVLISNTGYTGAGGFELYFPNEVGETIWNAVFEAGAEFDIKPIGLGARDTLRLEMGFCLYGNDIDDTTSPIEAGLGWVTKFTPDKHFPSRAIFEKQKAEGVSKKRIGFQLLDKGIARHGFELTDASGRPIGHVTSGNISPVSKIGIGMGYVETAFSAVGTEIFVNVRGRLLKAQVVKMPFRK